MSIKIADQYANAVPADANYPGGSFKNKTSSGSTDGTPLEKAWANDLLGFRDAILAAAGQAYSGAPDTAVASDALAALNALFIEHSLATEANDFLVSSGAGVFVKKTLAQVQALLGIGGSYLTSTGTDKTIYGMVNSNGTIGAGTGYSVVHSTTGVWVVTFTTPFTGIPVITCSDIPANANALGTKAAIVRESIAANSFTIKTGILNSHSNIEWYDPADVAFSFHAIGPK